MTYLRFESLCQNGHVSGSYLEFTSLASAGDTPSPAALQQQPEERVVALRPVAGSASQREVLKG